MPIYPIWINNERISKLYKKASEARVTIEEYIIKLVDKDIYNSESE